MPVERFHNWRGQRHVSESLRPLTTAVPSSVATPVAMWLPSTCVTGRGCPAKTIWYISTLILGQHGSDGIHISSILPCRRPHRPETPARYPRSAVAALKIPLWTGVPRLRQVDLVPSSLLHPAVQKNACIILGQRSQGATASPNHESDTTLEFPIDGRSWLNRPRKGCSFSIRIAGRGWGDPSRKTSVLGIKRQAPHLIWCGASPYSTRLIPRQIPTVGRSCLRSITLGELEGRNPRQTTLWCRGWLRNRCVSESFRVDGSAPETQRIGRNSLRKRTAVWSLKGTLLL